MHVRVLGELRVGSSAPSRVTHLRQQRILAALVIAGRGGLSVEALVDRVWEDHEVPASAVPTLRTYIQRLRRTAGDPAGELIRTRPGGYVLDVASEDVDARRFVALVDLAARELDPHEALPLLDAALALWRGTPFAELDDEWLQGERARLAEVRLQALESRLAIRLELGARNVAVEAAALLADEPYRERLVELWALALARSGRTVDALAVLREHAARMADGLGLEPSATLRDLEVAILRQDPAIDGPRRSGPRLRGYRLGPSIGVGAYSVVYRANQPSVGRDVAVKVIRRELANDPTFVRRFATQAQTVARLSHPQIVPLHDYWREADQAVLVMRWLEGGSVAELVADGPMDGSAILRLMAQVGAALDFAHRRGVVHGNLKPSNILLDSEGNAYVADFGLVPADQPEGRVAPAGDTARFAAPEQLSGADVGPRADVYALGMILDLLASEPTSAPSGSAGPSFAEVIARATDADPDARYASAGHLAAAVAGLDPTVHHDPSVQDPVNPYRGLRAFGEPDAAVFFGRDRLADDIAARLRDEHGVLVVGPSGCGKTSLLHAGVVPRLRAAPDHPVVTSMVPGADPVASLVEALRMVGTDAGADIEALVDAGELADVVARLSPAAPVFLVVDQLEELFTAGTPERSQRFLALLAAALQSDRGPGLLLSVRADFFDHPLASPSLGPLIGQMVQPVPPLSTDELVAVIAEPARSVGVHLTQALVGRLVADVADQPSRLPLLQFALTEMFDARRGPTIGIEDLDRIGGITGAVVTAAEDHFAALSALDRDGMRRLLSRLVVVAEEVTRRRELRADVEAVPGVTPALVDTLISARLLTVDRQPLTREPTVELVHEALLDAWPRLHRWVEEDRALLAAASRLNADATQWDDAARDGELLYRGGRLAAAELMVAEGMVGLSTVERDFVDAGVALREATAAEEQRATHLARVRARRRRVAAVGLVSAAAVGLTAAGIGLTAARNAATERTAVELTRLLATAGELADSRPDLAALLAAEAYTRDDGPASQGALLTVLRRLNATVETWTEARFDVGTSQGGCSTIPAPGVVVVQPNTFADGLPDPVGAIVEIDVAAHTVTRLRDLPTACHVRRTREVSADPAAPRYVTENDDGATVVLDAQGRTLVEAPQWHGPLFDPDGAVLARAGKGPAPYHRLDTSTGTPIGEAVFTGQDAWLSPGGTRLIVVGPIGEGILPEADLTMLDTATYEEIALLTRVLPASPLAWAPDDAAVVMSDERGTLSAWSGKDGKTLFELSGVNASLAAVSPDGSTLAVADRRGRVQFRSMETGALEREVNPGQQVLMELEWADADRVAAIGSGGVVSLLDPKGGGLATPGPACCASEEFSILVPDGQPAPFAYFGNYVTGQGRFAEIGSGATATVDMTPYVFDPFAAEIRLPGREAFLLTADGRMFLVDGGGTLVASGRSPARHESDGPAQVLRLTHSGVDHVAILGFAGGERQAVTILDLAVVDPFTLATVGDPVTVELPEPANYARLQDFGRIAVEYPIDDTLMRVEFRDLKAKILKTLELPAPLGWAVLTADGRYVVAARSADDSLRVVDTETGATTVLPVNAEPTPPLPLTGSRFLLQTREGQMDVWDAAEPARIGMLANVGPYAMAFQTLSVDRETAWLVADDRWLAIPVTGEEWLRRACALAGRALTEQEWRDIVPGDSPYRDACARLR